jgi:predicted GNAT family acetyltransferase/ABC-type transporter Mla MlaB component
MSILENTYAIESNLSDFNRTVARLSNRSVFSDKHISWVNCAPSPWPNAIFDANFRIENVDENILFVKGQIDRRVAPKIWITGPSMHPQNLDERLLACGFLKRSEWSGMALEFAKLKIDFHQPPGLDIQIVTDEKDLKKWAGVVSTALFGCPESVGTSFYELMTTVLHCDKVTMFVGYYQNQPAASSTLFVSNDIAGIYHVATMPAFRKKGIGRSITLAPLIQAREMGARFAVLQATSLGKSVYSSLGFIEYCTMGIFSYTPSS